MPDLLQTELKSEPLDVKSLLRLVSITIEGDIFRATYLQNRALADGTTLPISKFTVDRTISGKATDLSAWVQKGITLSEQWRQEDLAAGAASQAAQAAEAARWAALDDKQKQTEIDAYNAANPTTPVLFDPTPNGQ